MADTTHKQRRVPKSALTILETLFVLLSGSAIVMFVLWLGSAVAGKPLDLSLPTSLESAVSSIWGWLVTAAGSALLRLVIGRTDKQYLLWILLVALLLLASVFMSARFLAAPPPPPSQPEFSVSDFNVNRVNPSCEGPSPPPALVPIELGNGLLNLALLKRARASASTELQGHSLRHKTEFLNDGWYNNCRSWVADQMPAWAAIDLGEVYEVSGIKMGSEHQAMHQGRAATQFVIQVSTGQVPGNWDPVYRHPGKPVSGTEEFSFTPVPARHVRILIDAADTGQVRIDELEVVGRKLGQEEERK